MFVSTIEKEDEEEGGGNVAQFDKEIANIKKKKKTFKSLWRLFSLANKMLMIINFSTLLFCILIPNSNIGLVLSIYTLSFSIICNTSSHIPTLENLVVIYEDEIIPKIDLFVRTTKDNNARGDDYDDDSIYRAQQIEKGILSKYMGESFFLSNTLRNVDCKRILACAFIYVVMFVCIPIIYNYASSGQIQLLTAS